MIEGKAVILVMMKNNEEIFKQYDHMITVKDLVAEVRSVCNISHVVVENEEHNVWMADNIIPPSVIYISAFTPPHKKRTKKPSIDIFKIHPHTLSLHLKTTPLI